MRNSLSVGALGLALFCPIPSVSAQSVLRVPSSFPTITAAMSAAVDGDTVLVDPGTYMEAGIDFAGRRIVLRSLAGPEATVIDAGGGSRVLDVQSGEPAGTRVEGFTLRGSTNIAVFVSATVEIVDCVIEDNTSASSQMAAGLVMISGADVAVRRCVFRNNVGAAQGGVTVLGPPFGVEVQALFEQCMFLENRATGALSPMAGGGAMRVVGVTETTVRDCLFAANESTPGAAGIATFGGFSPLTVTVEGCTFVGHPDPVLMAQSALFVVRDTVIWGNTGAALGGSGSSYDLAYCDIEGGAPASSTAVNVVDVDPLYVDAMNGDYRLSAGSPLIDAGDPNRAVSGNDVFGDTRVVDGDGDTLRRRDIGADEYTVFSIAPSAQSPAAGAMFTVDATTAAPSSLLGGILLVSLDRDDVFQPAFGQLQVGLVDFLSFDLSSGTVQLTNPGALGLSVHAQAIGILDDGASGAFVQLSNPIELRLQ